MENMTRAEALNEISEVLARLPDDEIWDATNHLVGIINGMVMAAELRKTKENGAA